MSRRRLVRELRAVRVLVRDGLDRLDAEVGDAEQFWVASARHRLVSLDDVLVSAAGGLSAWSRTLISSAVAFPLLWAVATGARALGLGSGWVIVITVAALAVAMPVLLAATARISRAVNRRRMSRPADRAHTDGGRIPRQRAPEAPQHDPQQHGPEARRHGPQPHGPEASQHGSQPHGPEASQHDPQQHGPEARRHGPQPHGPEASQHDPQQHGPEAPRHSLSAHAGEVRERHRSAGKPDGRPPECGAAPNGSAQVEPASGSGGQAWGDAAFDGKGDRTEPIVDVLLRARVRLVSAALRQVASQRWRVGQLARLAADDRSIGRIADADLLLCQAIDFIEIYVSDRKPGWVR